MLPPLPPTVCSYLGAHIVKCGNLDASIVLGVINKIKRIAVYRIKCRKFKRCSSVASFSAAILDKVICYIKCGNLY